MEEVIRGRDFEATKRGRCQDANCDCDRFSYIAKAGYNCIVCGHYPAKHIKLLDLNESSGIVQNTAEVKDPSTFLDSFSSFQQFISMPDGQLPFETPTAEEILEELSATEHAPSDNGFTNTSLGRRTPNSKGNKSPSLSSTPNTSRQKIVSPIARSTPRRSQRFTPISKGEANSIPIPDVSPRRSPRFTPNSSRQSSASSSALTVTTTMAREHLPRKSLTFETPTSSAKKSSKLSATLLESCIPKVWPDDIAQVLKDMKDAPEAGHKLSRAQKLYMTRKITDRAIDNGITPPQFSWVADHILREIPALQSTVVPGSAAFITAMKNCIANKRWYANKKASKAATDPKTIDVNTVQSRMQQECARKNPSINFLKSALKAIRKKRLLDAKVTAVSTHLKDFPALRDPSLMFWEFSQIVGVPEETLRNRILIATPKLVTYLGMDPEFQANATLDVKCALAILKLARKFKAPLKGRKKADENSVFRVHTAGTLSSQAVPEAGHAPCMVAIGDPEEENLSVVVYADCFALFAGTVTQAVPVLVAAYFVFEAKWPTTDKLLMILLSAITVPEKMKSEITKKKSVLEVLEAVGVSVV